VTAFEVVKCEMCDKQAAMIAKGSREEGRLFFCSHEHACEYAEEYVLETRQRQGSPMRED
jgi:hypothetical protein